MCRKYFEKVLNDSGRLEVQEVQEVIGGARGARGGRVRVAGSYSSIRM